MRFSAYLSDVVCGLCNERKRSSVIQHQHSMYLDTVYGCYIECPECGNVFDPTEAVVDLEDDPSYLKTDSGSVDPETVYGMSILDKINTKITVGRVPSPESDDEGEDEDGR